MKPAKAPAAAPAILAKLRLTCLELPRVTEQIAWTGVRWCVSGKNFAHVLNIESGWSAAYAKAASTDGPACVLTFRLSASRCAAARFRRTPFFRPAWFPNIAGVVIDRAADWDELDALVRDSYRVLAPKGLASLATT